MKVIIGKQIFSSTDIPIMLVLDDVDKKAISNMEETTKYVSCPDTVSDKAIDEWIDWAIKKI